MDENPATRRKKTAAEQRYFGLLDVTEEDIDRIIDEHPYVMSRLAE